MNTAKIFVLSMVMFAFLDAIWLGYIMSSKYKEWMGPLARLNPDGSFNINFIAAIGVYILLAAAVTVFVVPKIGSASLAYTFLFGALMGLIIYGVYDLTNAATLVRWPLMLIVADMAWGAMATGTVAVGVRYFIHLFRWV